MHCDVNFWWENSLRSLACILCLQNVRLGVERYPLCNYVHTVLECLDPGITVFFEQQAL